MKKAFTLFCMVLGILIGHTLTAQEKAPRVPQKKDTISPEIRYFEPMKFPEQNLNPDPSINNEQAVQFDGATHQEIRFETDSILPEYTFVPGHKGIKESIKGNHQGNNSRGFSAMMSATDLDEYPASTIVRLEMTFPSGYASQCSGALIDPKHVLTAGHCVYRHQSGGWATDIEVAPAYDNGENEFFGTANRAALLSWEGWTMNSLFEHDMAVIELDRPVGALTGSLGYGYNNTNSFFTTNTFHNYSYPGEAPYDGHEMYYRQGDFDNIQTLILNHSNYSWGGQSGSAAPDDNYIAYSCLSHGTSNNTGHTRMNSTKFDHIDEFITEHTPSSPDLIALRATASDDYVDAGTALDHVYFLLHNYSSATYNGTIEVKYYLSQDDYITGGDIHLGTKNFSISGLTGKTSEWLTSYSLMNIPASTYPGLYYIGVHITNSDGNTLNNYSDYQDAFPIEVYCGQPDFPTLNYSGALVICGNESITLTATNICEGCEVLWSNWEVGPSITVNEPGTYYAFYYKPCGIYSLESSIVSIGVIPLPVAPDIEATGPTEFCEWDFVTLTATNICDGCTVYWSNGQTGPSIFVFTEGEYSAFMENSCGSGIDSDPIFITTIPEPSTIPEISALGSTELCEGESVTLTATNICNGCEVNWSNGHIGNSVTTSIAGNYWATMTNECGESAPSNSISVMTGSDPVTPVISANNSTVLCEGGSVTLTASEVCFGCLVIWSTGQTGSSITVSIAGNYWATQTNDCGQSALSNNINVMTGSNPAAPIISSNNSTALCIGESVTLTATQVCSGCLVQWSTGQTGSSITVSIAGNYWATQTNDCGQSSSSNAIEVTLENLPSVPIISADMSSQLCDGESVTLTASNVCSGCKVHWSNGETGLSIIVSEMDNYSAIVSNDCGESAVSNTINITVEPPYFPTVQVNGTCHLAAPLGTLYQWLLNGIPIVGATGQFLVAGNPGYYVVVMTSPSGCEGMSAPIFAEPCVTSTTEKEANTIVSLFPNPATDHIRLEYQSAIKLTDVKLQLYNSEGQHIGLIWTADFLSGNSSSVIRLPDLPSGLYFFTLISHEAQIPGRLMIVR